MSAVFYFKGAATTTHLVAEKKEETMSIAKVRDAVKEAQDKGLLVLSIIFDAEELTTGRFTQEEVAAAITHINDFGEGFGDISAYALVQFEKYMEETYGAAADASR